MIRVNNLGGHNKERYLKENEKFKKDIHKGKKAVGKNRSTVHNYGVFGRESTTSRGEKLKEILRRKKSGGLDRSKDP